MESRVKEKRYCQRIKLNTPLHYKIRGTGKFCDTINDDISLGGMGFINNEFLPPKTPITLEFNVAARVLNPIARVVWSFRLPHSDKYRVGLKFEEFNPMEKNYLSDYIDMQRGHL